MTRETPSTPSPRLRPPVDGLVAAGRPEGTLAKQWLRVLDRIPTTAPDRLARGRGLARSRRVRDLWVSPGLASAEVVDKVSHQVSLRFSVLDDRVWQRALSLLTAKLSWIASLIEGELPDEVLREFAKAGVHLLPGPHDLDGLCECGDYAMPCAHMAAVHCVLASALDGEPFLLLTLRGRPREQVLTALRNAWGEVRGGSGEAAEPAEPAPAGDWYASPVPPPHLSFSFQQFEAPVPGLRELGPPPGRADLDRALEPLYAAGRAAALDLALKDAPSATHDDEAEERSRVALRRAARRSPRPHRPDQDTEEVTMTETPRETESARPSSPPSPSHLPRDPAPASAPSPEHIALGERIVDMLASADEGLKSLFIADELGQDRIVVRDQLVELEELGIVYRTGRTRGTRWWLG